MTEQKWLASGNPQQMLAWAIDARKDRTDGLPIASARKLRLFACSCCRQAWDRLTDERSRRAVEVAERYADGETTVEQLSGSCRNWGPCESSGLRAAEWVVASYVTLPFTQAALLREIFGNPYRPVKLPMVRDRVPIGPFEIDVGTITHGFGTPYCPWLSTTVLSIATAIYAERAFGRMPILGDALEDAGCTDAMILAHCRGVGMLPDSSDEQWQTTHPHVRGCWVVDLLLGKE